jgi:nicotinamidase/pyrazinamidase
VSDACLIVVDVQNDFVPGGALAVPNGDEVVPVINRLAMHSENMVLTQDWHPRRHASFASSHPGKKPFQSVELAYGSQVLWPEHCVQGTSGADFHPDLDLTKAQLVIRKGHHREIDSYSAFLQADRNTAIPGSPATSKS